MLRKVAIGAGAFAAVALGTVSSLLIIQTDQTPVSNEERRQRWSTLAGQEYSQSVCQQEQRLGIRKLRQQLCQRARGNVLEVAAGTGPNLPFYPPENVSHLTLTDSCSEMCKSLSDQLPSQPGLQDKDTVVLQAGAEALPFADASFDTVVDTFGLCSVDDPDQALQEMLRVCRPDGQVLLLEHGRGSDWSPVTWYLDWRAANHARHWGCWWNRDMDAVLQRAAAHGTCIVVDKTHSHLGTNLIAVLRPTAKR